MYSIDFGKAFLNKTIKSIVGLEEYSEKVIFFFEDEKIHMFHDQDCCEYVRICEIIGHIEDLLNTPILMAEELTNEDFNDNSSMTHTFYKFATIKGYVTIRWPGESNGYYSEKVDIKCEKIH